MHTIIIDLTKLESLDGTNYRRYSQRMMIVLKQLRMDYVLHSDPPIIPASCAEDLVITLDVAKKA